MVNHRRNADCGLKQHYLKLANEERIFDRREIVGGGGGQYNRLKRSPMINVAQKHHKRLCYMYLRK